MKPDYPYQTPQVRDLAWACFSAPMMHTSELATDAQDVANCALAATPERLAWLESLDRDASALLAFLAERPTRRLGLYFEYLWHFFLQQDPAVELVAHNLPVQEGGRTLGEFDCIYLCRQRQRHVHLELTVKYFLGHGQVKGATSRDHWSHWLGPNTQDRLDLKIRQLFDRQIALSSQPAAAAQLEKLGIGPPLREVEIKGYLFQPVTKPLPPPPACNTGQSMASWVSIGALENFLSGLDCTRYCILPRLRGLSRAGPENLSHRLCADQLAATLRPESGSPMRPQLVAALDEAGWETQRFFVTGSDWPQLSEESPSK